MTEEIRPNYYEDKQGHDLFWDMEHGRFPYEESVGFCKINALKYQRRLGRKTKDTAADWRKMKTYELELIQLKKIHEEKVTSNGN